MATGFPISNNQRRLLCFLLLFNALSGAASTEIIQRIHAGIKGLARGMDYVGQQAGQLIGPGIPLQGETAAAFEHHRSFDEQYPMGQQSMISLSNEFGEVRVNTWDERVVRVTADIRAGAESEPLAEQLAQLIEIRVSHGENYLECRTVYPEVKSGGQMFLSVDYNILIPRDAGLTVDNFFGDVYLNDIGGMVVADVQYGGLDLKQIRGKTRARVQGDFPVHIEGLRQGGSFKFQGASVDITDIQGEVDINHFRGKVVIRQIAVDTHLCLNSDSAQAMLALSPEDNPDLSAVIAYGKLESALDVSRTLRGTQIVVRHPNAESRQKIDISAAFSEIIIAVEGESADSIPSTTRENKAFTDTRRESIAIADAAFAHIAAVSGNIQIEGADTDSVLVEATRIAWTPSASAALDALDALELIVGKEENAIQIETRIARDMTLFDCESYRIDLRIQCPRELPLRIHAEEGLTVVDGMGAGALISQRKGEITIEHVKGAVEAANEAGDVKIRDCSGPVDAKTNYGSLSIENVYGDIRANTVEGHTYVDAPHGAVYVRHKSGDVRVLCLEPIEGDFDILVEDGNLNVFLAPSSNAALSVKAVNGAVQSSMPLSGSINRDFQEFFGRLNDESHAVRLETLNGDIFLN